MHNNLGRLHEKLSMLSCPQGQIIDVKCEKSQINYIYYLNSWTCPRTGDYSNKGNKFGVGYIKNFSCYRAHKDKLFMQNENKAGQWRK